MDEVRALSALLSDFQRLVYSQSSSNSDMRSESLKGKSEVEVEEEDRTSRTSSSRSVGNLSYSGGSEASPSITDEKSNHSSPPPSLPVSTTILNKETSPFSLLSFSFFLHFT